MFIRDKIRFHEITRKPCEFDIYLVNMVGIVTRTFCPSKLTSYYTSNNYSKVYET